jgi:hypothetical protein
MDEHWDRAPGDDGGTDAPEKERARSAQPARTHDDHIVLAACNLSEDFVRSPANPRDGRNGKVFLSLALELVVSRIRDKGRPSDATRPLSHANQRHRGVGAARQLDRILERLISRLRVIDGHEDAAEHSFHLPVLRSVGTELQIEVCRGGEGL